MNNIWGFSALELITVLLIVALIAGSANLRSSSLLKTRRLKSASAELLRQVEHWAIEARYRQEDVHLVFEKDSVVAIREQALSGPDMRKSLPRGIHYHQPRFANLKLGERVLTLRKNGSATPGKVELISDCGQSCKLTHSLRNKISIRCSK